MQMKVSAKIKVHQYETDKVQQYITWVKGFFSHTQNRWKRKILKQMKC